jgi:hypothetical protein
MYLYTVLSRIMGDKKGGARQEKRVLHISSSLLNYSSINKVLKSLTQVHGHIGITKPSSNTTCTYICSPEKESPQKCLFFCKYKFLGKTMQFWSFNTYSLAEMEKLCTNTGHCRMLQTQKVPIFKDYLTAQS